MVYRSGGSGSMERPQNVFRNDGSFLEMFKKLQEVQKIAEAAAAASSSASSQGTASTESPSTSSDLQKTSSAQPSKPAPFVGKRRGGRVLPTGKVKKPKLVKEDENKDGPKDAWSIYLEEVKRYKETTCEEDEKTRPLVK